MISYGEFVTADYLVLCSILLLCLGTGFYFACYGGKQKTSDEYFKGDTKMSVIPVVLSMMATYISSNWMLGIPAEVYYFGFNYWFTGLGAILGIPVAVYGFVPVFYKMRITSVFEYIERRFNKSVRCCGSVICILTLLIYSSFMTYAPALALSQVTGLNLWGSIITTTAIATVYTSIGGVKAVMWTDTLQVIIFTATKIAIIVKGCATVGGISVVVERSIAGSRLEALSFSLDPRVRFTFWGIFIHSTLAWCGGYGTSQILVQKYLSCPTLKSARRSICINGPGLILIGTIYCLIGLVLYANYWNCDPYASQQIEQPDQIFPLYVMKTMSGLPGMCGLFVAGVYNISLSAVSSVLNSLAAITLEDHVKPRKRNLSDEKATRLSKFIAVAYGVLSIMLIFAATYLGNIIQASSYLIGGTNGANFGLFTLAFFIPWANARGSLVGIACGISVAWWVAIGNQIYKPTSNFLPISLEGCNVTLGDWIPRSKVSRTNDVLELYKISYFWVLPLAWFVTVIVGSVSSLFLKKSAKNYDVSLLSPFVRCIMKRFCKEKYDQMRIGYQQSSLRNEDTITLSSLSSPECLENTTTEKVLHPSSSLGENDETKA